MKRSLILPTMCARADGRIEAAVWRASIRRCYFCLDASRPGQGSLAPHLGLAAGAAARFRAAHGCYARAPRRATDRAGGFDAVARSYRGLHSRYPQRDQAHRALVLRRPVREFASIGDNQRRLRPLSFQ